MAIHLDSKAPTEVQEYRWDIDLGEGDKITGKTLTASGATLVSSETDGECVTFIVSGGTTGTTATIAATATTQDGLTFVETFYLPIQETDVQFLDTAREIINFALRRVTGLSRSPRAPEAADALERLNDMLAMWRIDGLDIGIAGELTLDSQLKIADEYLLAVKYNLIVALHDLYESEPLAPQIYKLAEDSKRLVANRLFDNSQLGFSTTLTIRAETVADLF